MTRARRGAAKRPTRRTVDVAIEGGIFDGWQATAYADFPARVLSDLASGDIDRVVSAMGRIVVSHNMPNDHDEIAESLADVDPYEGLVEISKRILDGIAALPPR